MDTDRTIARLNKMEPLARARRAEELRLDALNLIAQLADIRAGAIADAVAAGTRPAEVARQLGVTGPVVTKALKRIGARP